MQDLRPRIATAGVISMMFRKLSLNNALLLCALLFSTQVEADCNSDITPTKPNSIYVDHGNGTVTDTETGLMWMKCSLGRSGANCEAGTYSNLNWKQALDAAQSANDGAGTFGYTDWRLPSVNELISLTELACYDPAINTALFPATLSGYYWSSSPYTDDNEAWFLDFASGQESVSAPSSAKGSTNRVRLVRNSQ